MTLTFRGYAVLFGAAGMVGWFAEELGLIGWFA